LHARRIEVCYDLNDHPYDAVLIVGATRRLGSLWRAKRDGVPIYQRLNGMNWLHRRRRTGWRHYLRAEVANRMLRWTRDHLASGVIYQSQFAKDWWERVYGPTPGSAHVVLNGIDLEQFTPQGQEQPPDDRAQILIVEGRLAGGYELGLEHALALGEKLSAQRNIELVVAGRVEPDLQAESQARVQFPIRWMGLLPADEIPALDRSSHLLFSADIHPACPNAVVEALACGLPVVSFKTGALPELVSPQAGILVEYGSDPWQLQTPDFESLAHAADHVLDNQEAFRTGARARAKAGLSVETMTDGYLRAIGWD
jgi:glycosyltransferase involved in cell wall biosynthesis